MDKANFTERLLDWHRSHSRPMPWKGERDPYRIWVSEIMLQQTRVEQAAPYYKRFVKRFPDSESLAQAEEDDLLKYWAGLGYYSRAHHMHEAARYIQDELDGHFPSTYNELIELKGVGPYTAAAIASFAFGERKAVVDGNVIRVISRFFGIDAPIDRPAGRKKISDLAQELIDEREPAAFNQAIMDFGAGICLPSKPECRICPLSSSCISFQNGLQHHLPVKSGKRPKKAVNLHLLLFVKDDHILLQKRDKRDIWKGLYHPPAIESGQEKISGKEITAHFPGNWTGLSSVRLVDERKWVLSHRQMRLFFYELAGELNEDALSPGLLFIPLSKMKDFAMPRVIETFLSGYFPDED